MSKSIKGDSPRKQARARKRLQLRFAIPSNLSDRPVMTVTINIMGNKGKIMIQIFAHLYGGCWRKHSINLGLNWQHSYLNCKTDQQSGEAKALGEQVCANNAISTWIVASLWIGVWFTSLCNGISQLFVKTPQLHRQTFPRLWLHYIITAIKHNKGSIFNLKDVCWWETFSYLGH